MVSNIHSSMDKVNDSQFFQSSAPTVGEGSGCTPVALFVYNRADNTRRTLRALLENSLAPFTDLYVYSDGGRDEDSWGLVREVRSVLKDIHEEVCLTHALRSMTIVERPTNYYLERNVIEGIADVLSRHDSIIVLEDDIVSSPFFLQFMNDAFRLYRDDTRVMHVTGFTRIEASDNYFTPFMAGWGWGTWRDRWQKHFRHYTSRAEALEGLTSDDINALEYGGVFPCLKHLDRNPIPWDICWGIAIRRARGLCFCPHHSLVRNIGLDAGTHFRSLDFPRRRCSIFGHQFTLPALRFSRLIQRYEFDCEPYAHRITLVRQTPAEDSAIEAAMARALTDWGIRYTWLGRIVRSIYKRL